MYIKYWDLEKRQYAILNGFTKMEVCPMKDLFAIIIYKTKPDLDNDKYIVLGMYYTEESANGELNNIFNSLKNDKLAYSIYDGCSREQVKRKKV